MSSDKKKETKGVVNTFRRTWDREDFEDKAKDREDKASACGRAAAAVNASRSGVLGVMKAAPGRCRPITSINIWLLFAVP